MLLSANDLYEISGYKMKSRQRMWLQNNGIRFILAADGSPKVLISQLEAILGAPRQSRNTKANKPNFSALLQSNA